MLGQVVDVVGALARHASGDRDAAVAVSTRHVGLKVEVDELVVKRLTVGDVRCWCGADGEDPLWADRIKGLFGLEHNGARAFLAPWWMVEAES